jgi:hypothetical protein
MPETIDKPNPLPGPLRAWFPRQKRSKARSPSASSMPGPSSSTSTTILDEGGHASALLTDTTERVVDRSLLGTASKAVGRPATSAVVSRGGSDESVP